MYQLVQTITWSPAMKTTFAAERAIDTPADVIYHCSPTTASTIGRRLPAAGVLDQEILAAASGGHGAALHADARGRPRADVADQRARAGPDDGRDGRGHPPTITVEP
jgi:hypothetical protein